MAIYQGFISQIGHKHLELSALIEKRGKNFKNKHLLDHLVQECTVFTYHSKSYLLSTRAE